MTRLLVAAHFVWDEYPGLRAGRLYAGKGDIGTHPRGDTHAVASADSATTVCGQSRANFTYEFAESVSLIAADACPSCRIAAGDTSQRKKRVEIGPNPVTRTLSDAAGAGAERGVGASGPLTSATKWPKASKFGIKTTDGGLILHRNHPVGPPPQKT